MTWYLWCCGFIFFFFFKQKTAYEIGTGDWSSDVCFRSRASVTGEIVMEDVDVGEDALMPGVEGLKGPFGCLDRKSVV